MVQVMRHCIHTNDCCSRLVGSITKVWQPFTTNMHTRKMSDINDVLSKLWLDFCQILNFSPLQDSMTVQHVAMRHCIHTNDCCSRLVGSINKVWQPFTTNMHTGKMLDIIDVLSKLWLDFCQIPNFSPFYKTQYQCNMVQVMRHCIHQWLLQ